MTRMLTSLLLLLTLAACSGGGSVRHYLIDPQPGPRLAAAEAAPLVVEIIDVELPRYLDRYSIVRRAADGELLLASGHQWGEGLRLNLLRTLAINLGEQLGIVDVATPRARTPSRPDYRVLVLIEAFEADAEGRIHLDARWQLLAGGDNRTLTTRLSRLRSEQRVGARDYPGQVDAMAVLFGRLSAEIAAALLAHDAVVAAEGRAPS